MDQQLQQQVQQQLQSKWDQIYPQILKQFTQVSTADLITAEDADDLVRRISDRTGFSPTYVETKVVALAMSGGASPQSGGQQQPFGGQQGFSPQR